MSPDPVSSGLPAAPDLSTEPRKEAEGLIDGDFFQRGTLFRMILVRGSGVRISEAFDSTIFNPSCTKRLVETNVNYQFQKSPPLDSDIKLLTD